jgi:hypothetical protein
MGYSNPVRCTFEKNVLISSGMSNVVKFYDVMNLSDDYCINPK